MKYYSQGLLLSLLLLSSSCSVVMAAKKEGVSLEELQRTKKRGEMISMGAQVITSERMADGSIVEVYKVLAKKGSIGRSVMHGLLDVSTLGLWEVAGTPIEANAGNKKFYSIRVHYDQNETVQKIELM